MSKTLLYLILLIAAMAGPTPLTESVISASSSESPSTSPAITTSSTISPKVTTKPVVSKAPLVSPTHAPQISVTPIPPPTPAVSPTPTPKTPLSFVIEGDDYGMYPAAISISKGEEANITFKARQNNVYFGGLDFRGGAWGDTGTIPPGGSKTVTFTANATFQFESYWPASNVLKATGTVNVN